MESLIKKLQNIMRGDDLSGTVQYLKQMIWMIFLKIYDAQEEKWELLEDDYTSIIPEELKWRNWAVDNNDGKALTGDELIKFVNDELIMGLKKLEVNEYTPKRHLIVWQMFQDAANFMKNGTKLRQMINELNEKDFTNSTETHEFGDMYESMLKDLQESKRDGGEFYTPRALTDFIVEKVDPRLGEKVADFISGYLNRKMGVEIEAARQWFLWQYDPVGEGNYPVSEDRWDIEGAGYYFGQYVDSAGLETALKDPDFLKLISEYNTADLASLSVEQWSQMCQETLGFSDNVRNLIYNIKKYLLVKQF